MVVRRLAGVVEAEGLLDEAAFALEGGAFELDAEGVAEDLDGVGVGVQGAADGGDQVLVFGEALQGLLDDALAGAGNAEHQAQSALLTMDLEGVVNLLLLGQEFEFAAGRRGFASVRRRSGSWLFLSAFESVGDGVEEAGGAHALALVVDDDGGGVAGGGGRSGAGSPCRADRRGFRSGGRRS